MDDTVTISFARPISTCVFEVPHKEDLTCEDLILKCLKHVQEQMKIDPGSYPRKTAAGISSYVPAFGLQIISRRKKTYIPLHYKFSPHKHHKDYKFCVRHIPPCPEEESLSEKKIPFYNLVWQLFILQGIEDFLWTELNHEAELSEHDVMALATLALIIISFSDSAHDKKRIDEKFKLENFNLFNYRKHFSKAFVKCLTKATCPPNWFFDYVFYYTNFKQWISHFKSENKFLGTYKQEFIYNFLMYHPHYGIERYDVKRRADDHTLEDCSVEIRMSQRGKNQQLGLYLNRQNACNLTKIQQVIIRKKDPENSGHEVLIATESVEQYFCLIFKESEELDSFLSLLQGSIFLSIQPNLYLNRELMPQSAVLKELLRSFWPMRHSEASALLSSSNMWKPEKEQRRFLLYQDKDDLYTFTAAIENKEDTRYQVHCTPMDKFTICEDGKLLMSFTEAKHILRYFYDEYGSQLYPKLITKKQNVDPNSLYYLKVAECEEIEECGSDEPKDFNNLNKFIQEKDMASRSKMEMSNENDDLKRFRVLIKGEDKLLVEVQSRHPKAQEAIMQNILTMTQLSEVSPKSILNFHLQAFVSSMKLSFVFEYPTHGTLNVFLNTNRDNLSWLHKLRICLQVISVLNTIQSKGIFHGNIRSSNFYVFIYENGEPIVKLGDPGLVYMYDDPQCEFSYLNQRSPWMAPERLENLQCINKDTECYAVGTTLCEILHGTDDLKSLLKLPTDEDVMKFFKQGNKIPPPDLSYSENDPNTVMPEIREIMDKAWKVVESCWNKDPNERPTALELACEFRELTNSASELPFERLMDYLKPVLSGSEGALTPKDVSGLLEKQSAFYINPDQVILTDDVLGHGHFGEVKKCRIWKQKSTGDNMEKEEYPEVAAKTLFESTNNPSMIKEIDLIASLNHENIVRFLHFTFKKEGPLILIMEYLKEGNLLKFVRDINKKPDKNDRKMQYFMTLLKLSHDVAKGMEYLHSQKIIHCDLAARNVLLYKDTQHAVTKVVAKVGDLGLAKIVKVNQNYYSGKREKGHPLPFCWSAPEYLVADENNSNKLVLRYEGDVWAYGILLWEVFTLGRAPIRDFPTDELLYPKLINGWRLEEKYLQFDDNTVYTDLMMKCWEMDYTKRPAFSELNSIIQGLRLPLEKTLSFA